MGRESKLLIVMIMAFMQSCIANNSTSPQTSRNIEEARKNGTFISEFYAEAGHFDSIIVESAWVEKVWYKENNGQKTITNHCKLCFKIKQLPGGKFLLNDVLDWDIKEANSNRNVGVEIRKSITDVSGVYTFELINCEIPDSILFNLYIKSIDKKNKIGDLSFKREGLPDCNDSQRP